MAIDLDLLLQEVESDSSLLSMPGMDNIRGSIRQHGRGLFADAPIQARIKDGATAPIQASIATPTITAPIDPLAVHIGQGNLFLGWSHATPELVSYYELYVSTSLAGTYVKLTRGEFQATHGSVQNIPLGRSLYFQLRAIGLNGAISSFTQIKRGKFYQPTIPLKVRGISGSTIPAGVMFSSLDQETGKLLLVQAQALITIP